MKTTYATLRKKLEAEKEKMKAEVETAREGTPTTDAGRNSEERTKREGKRRMKAVVEIPLKPAKVSGEMAVGSWTEAKRRAADESELVKLRVQERIELDNQVKELDKLSLDVSMADGMALRQNDRAKDERLREYEARLASAYEQGKHLSQQIDRLEAENEELVDRYSGGGSKRRRFYTPEHSEYGYVSGSNGFVVRKPPDFSHPQRPRDR